MQSIFAVVVSHAVCEPAVVDKGAVSKHQVCLVATGVPKRTSTGEQHHRRVADHRDEQREQRALRNR